MSETDAGKVDAFFIELDRWGDEARALREIVDTCGLEVAWKWKQPCYVHGGTNVLMIAPFAKYCALAFFAGALLDDPDGVLVAPGKDSQSARQLRFTAVEEVTAQRERIVGFIEAAKRNVDEGTKVEFTAKDELELPVELVERFADVDGLETAFHALTPGRQRGFVLHISGAKKAATRSSRVEGHMERILAGKGIHDCVCGKSAKMPRCDGSHAR